MVYNIYNMICKEGVLLKNNNLHVDVGKLILYIAIAILVLISIIYFARCYLSDGEIVFTHNEAPLLFIVTVAIIFVSLLVIFLTVKVCYLESAVVAILEDIASSEDNSIEFQRITQNMIMNLSKKLGVEGLEKED